MTGRNASRLEAGLIARKGQAAPARAAPSLPPPDPPPPDPPPSGPEEPIEAAGPGDPDLAANRTPRGMQGTIAVTVRLDPGRYERMKVHGARRRRTNQDILVEALDRYFASVTE